MSAILRTALFRSLSKNNYLHYSYNEQLLASIKRINLPLQNVGVRLLFTQEILAIDKYLDARNKITAQFGDMRSELIIHSIGSNKCSYRGFFRTNEQLC